MTVSAFRAWEQQTELRRAQIAASPLAAELTRLARAALAEDEARRQEAEARAAEMEARYDRLTLTVARLTAEVEQLKGGEAWVAPEAGWYEWQSGQEPRKVAAGPLSGGTAASSVAVDWASPATEALLVAARGDGTVTGVKPEVTADGSWSYLVPEGITWVAGRAVSSGDTVEGKFEISDV